MSRLVNEDFPVEKKTQHVRHEQGVALGSFLDNVDKFGQECIPWKAAIQIALYVAEGQEFQGDFLAGSLTLQGKQDR